MSIRVRACPAVFAFLAALSLFAASCAPTPVERLVRAVWAPDASSLLLVRSDYATRDPSNPHFADPEAEDWSLVLFELGAAGLPASGRLSPPAAAEIDRFPEEAWDEGLGKAIPLASGGLAQYTPVYWFPALRRAIFSNEGIGAYARDVDAGRTTWFLKPKPLIAEAFAAYGLPAATAAAYAGEADYRGAVPSPDGSLLAGSYVLPLLIDPIGGAYEHYTAIVLWDALSGEALDAIAPLIDLDAMPRGLEAGFPLETENPDFSSLVWRGDGSSLFQYFISDTGQSPTTRLIRLEGGERPALAMAEAAATVPPRPIPSSSGPVAADGRAIVLSIEGNETYLSLLPFPPGTSPPWAGFGAPEIPVETWYGYSTAFGQF